MNPRKPLPPGSLAEAVAEHQKDPDLEFFHSMIKKYRVPGFRHPTRFNMVSYLHAYYFC